MVKKKPAEQPHEEHADETWLIPYSDLLTLLPEHCLPTN